MTSLPLVPACASSHPRRQAAIVVRFGGCAPGISNGALILIGFAAELYSLNASVGFQRLLISGDYSFLDWQDRQAYRSMRTLQYVRNEKALASLYPQGIAHEVEFLFKNYAHLGVAGTPSFYEKLNHRFGYRPAFPKPARFGHPFEAGSHFSEHATRFLLMHECGHILKNHFGEAPSHEQELEADWTAFELGVRSAQSKHGIVASLLGAWLVLAIARRVEAYGDTGARSSHPPANDRLARLFEFVRTTNLIGPLTRFRVRYYLSDLERRDAVLAAASNEYREMVKDTNAISLFVGACVIDKSEPNFIGQAARWVIQFPPDRFFFSLAGARVELEQKIKQDPDDERAKASLAMIMKLYEAAGNNTASTLSSRLHEAYVSQIRRSA